MPDIDTTDTTDTATWRSTACILCSINCGIEVRLDGRRFARVRGDKAHPGSAGYTCEKALRLDHYQNDPHRLTTPLRRRPDGSFEAVDWDTAIAEVAARLAEVRATHGGERIFYYGGGGQGNHLGGTYATALRKAAGVTYASNALAQEKTGEFWVDGQLYGRPRCHTTPDLEHTEVAVFVGKNPWQSHGFPRARTMLKAIANDPGRAMVVIDPRRTETAALADVHLQVRPGTDAWCLAALLAVLVEEDLVDRAFVADRTTGYDELAARLREVPIAAYCARSGVDEADVRGAARRIAAADSVAIFEDLGIQQAPHSTLASYLEKLLYLLVGSFGKRGGMNIHTRFASLGGSGPTGGAASGSAGSSGGGRPGGRTTPVTGSRIITGLVPCNVIADEILTDHPDRFRAMIVESANPAHSLADSRRMREALAALDFVLVVDVALTETARLADYVLPAASQFEKPEATFFTLEYPSNVVHLRRPLLDPLPGTLPEAEIHTRLVRAMGALDGHADRLAHLRDAADQGLAAYGEAFFGLMVEHPELFAYAPVIAYETLGPTLPAGMAGAASMWALAQLCAQAYPEAVRRAGFEGEGPALGDALFQGLLDNPSGVVFTVDPDDETWRRLDTLDERIHLVIPELLPELAGLRDEDPTRLGLDGDGVRSDDCPFVLSAGERRSSTANTIYRDPTWRRKDPDGALRLNPDDAARLGVADGGRARVTTKRGSVEALVELTDTLQPGHASLPNGLGLAQPTGDVLGAATVTTGVAPNELTATSDRDWLAGTPWHKHVRARIEAVPHGGAVLDGAAAAGAAG